MAEQELFGTPKITMTFKTKGISAIKRSARGIVAMILHNETDDSIKTYRISDVTDIPDKGIDPINVDLIRKCLLGTPLRVLVYCIPKADVGGENTLSDALALLSSVKWNWLCVPTATDTDTETIVSWIKSMRENKQKTFKAVVANKAADHEGIVNFTTEDIKVRTGTDKKGVPEYRTYTATEYTARIAGILAGLALDRSATYFKLTEIESVAKYPEIDTNIDKGELVLFDEEDGDGVKIARASNSLVTFTTDKGEEFRKIKFIESRDMIFDDIRDTIRKFYIGKYINDYEHKMLLCSAILVYFEQLKGNVLDKDAKTTVDIDETFQRQYAILKGEKVEEMDAMDIRRYNTGAEVSIVGTFKIVDAMEDFHLNWTV